MDPLVISVIDTLKENGGNVALGVASNALWDWIKSKIAPKSNVAAATVQALETSPNDEDWETLKLQLSKVLKNDAALHAELRELLQRLGVPRSITQTANAQGIGNVIVQTTGNQNDIHI
jgi:hypothetical protein